MHSIYVVQNLHFVCHPGAAVPVRHLRPHLPAREPGEALADLPEGGGEQRQEERLPRPLPGGGGGGGGGGVRVRHGRPHAHHLLLPLPRPVPAEGVLPQEEEDLPDEGGGRVPGLPALPEEVRAQGQVMTLIAPCATLRMPTVHTTTKLGELQN